MAEHQNKFTPTRLNGIDVIRGLAITGMVAFHINYSLIYIFDSQAWNVSPQAWFWIGRISAVTFIMLAGFSFFLAKEKYGNQIYRKYTRVALQLMGFAILITLFTRIFIPQEYIQFGIIHFFSVSFFLMLFVFHLGYWNIPIAVIILLMGHGWDLSADVDFLYFLGFPYPGFRSADYYPLIPYFGWMQLGFVVGQYLHSRDLLHIFVWPPDHVLIPTLSFLGRHSLFIYLVHSPVILLILYVLLG